MKTEDNAPDKAPESKALGKVTGGAVSPRATMAVKWPILWQRRYYQGQIVTAINCLLGWETANGHIATLTDSGESGSK